MSEDDGNQEGFETAGERRSWDDLDRPEDAPADEPTPEADTDQGEPHRDSH